MKKLVISFLFFYAACSQAGQEVFSVEHVGIDLSTQVLFVGVDKVPSTTTCSQSSKEFKWNLADSGVKEIYSLALAAYAKGDNLRISVSESGICVNGQPTGRWVRIEKK